MFGIDDLLSGGLSFLGGMMAQDRTDERLQAQMDFQRQMSNTAYQRGMKDMKAAGLNPILAYQKGGASSPTGAFAAATDIVSPAVSSAQASKRLTPEIENMIANANYTKQQTVNAVTNNDLTKAQIGMTNAQTANSVMNTKMTAGVIEKMAGDAARGKTDAQILENPWVKWIRGAGTASEEGSRVIKPWFDMFNPFKK